MSDIEKNTGMEMTEEQIAEAEALLKSEVPQVVTGDMLIGEVVRAYPETIRLFMGIGMHCLGCGASQFESVSEAAMVHGIDPELLVDAVNVVIDQAAKAETEATAEPTVEA